MSLISCEKCVVDVLVVDLSIYRKITVIVLVGSLLISLASAGIY